MAVSKLLVIYLVAPLFFVLSLLYCAPAVALAATYYLGPNGQDTNSGRSAEAAWANFGQAWAYLQPGDILVLLDGTYHQPLAPNGRNGTAEAPITIRAQHDGQVTIDGQGIDIPVHLYRDYYVIEGIVARNGNHAVYFVSGSHNVLRRVSGYDANPDDNSDVFAIFDSHNNLLEDCVAAGTGRKMVMIYRGSHNTVRRCFADWWRWDGRYWCDDWPWGDNLQIYNSDYNIIENSIGYGSVPVWSIAVQANAPDVSAIGNQVLGSISIDAGMNHDSSVKTWPRSRPTPTACNQLRDFQWPSQRAGFALFGDGVIRDNLFRDIFAWGSAGLGLTVILDGDHANNVVDHVTLFNNGLDNPAGWGGIGAELRPEENYLWDEQHEVWVEEWDERGEGARLDKRYVDGLLTDEPLWPWPMEDRVRAELGLSPTVLVGSLFGQWEAQAKPLPPFIRDGKLVRPLANRCIVSDFDKVDTLYYDGPGFTPLPLQAP
ncbi:MAG TPA: chondroitinase-B domain-containing protein [Caldilineaceae bacterium]|nr:chondroitinase-B domain-containing protein [Caldilineaceae bacterium]